VRERKREREYIIKKRKQDSAYVIVFGQVSLTYIASKTQIQIQRPSGQQLYMCRDLFILSRYLSM
jgi:hypothetical protein